MLRTALKQCNPYLALALFLLCAHVAYSAEPNSCDDPRGDALFVSGKYDLAALSYYRPEFDRSNDCAERFALATMHEGKFDRARDALINRHSGASFLLRMFSGIPERHYNSVLFDRDQLLLSDASDRQKDVGRLLGLAVYLDHGDYDAASRGLADLQKQTSQEDLRLLIGRVRTDLMEFDRVPRKSPWIAGGLAMLLPGAGHVYTEQYSDAALAFFWNGLFLGGGAYLYSLENRANTGHGGSIVFGVAGLIFYLANITGASASAYRYNYFHERQFQQKIRERFFNLDFIEKQSGLSFETSY
ncbi:MAG: hypothetical protein KDK37_02100 [Leptospiraceae bacterium]|nr:hypothetical protein [Leptospiraceae bacterium]